MAYIDPEGMFGGDRMAMLSDSAKMAWPWFWCASNTVGRIELNYREFSKTVFRQFKKPPIEQQFWEWVAEFHEAYLLFVYEADGRAWGQWDVSAKYLPTYKLKGDMTTPEPTVRMMTEWRDKYTDLKRSLISGKCRVLNISKIIQNFSELGGISPKLSLCVGEERSGEIEEGSGEKPSCPADAEPPASHSLFGPEVIEKKYGEAWFTAQHDRWYDNAYWNKVKRAKSRAAYKSRVLRLIREKNLTHEQAAEFVFNQAVMDRQRWEPTEDWRWRSRMLPTTWLNESRWDDECSPIQSRAPTPLKTKQQQQVDEWRNV